MNTVAVIGRMLLALVLVLGIMWALARWARKPLGAGKGEQVLTVLARQQISRTSSVTVLRVMDRALVLGVTEQGVRLLTEAELAPIEEVLAAEPAPSRSWSRLRLPFPESAGSVAESAFPDGQNSTEVSLVTSSAVAAEPAGAPTKSPVVPAKRSPLDGSVLSPNTWRQVLASARDLTVRR